MTTEIRPVADSPMDQETDVVGTPEGDNEFKTDEPLHPIPEGAEQNPRGAEPEDEYKKDKA